MNTRSFRSAGAALFASVAVLGIFTAVTTAHAVYDPTTYNSTLPTFVNDDFTTAQKDAQRTAGTGMMQALVNAATGGAGSYTIAPGTYRVAAATWKLNGIANFTINCPNVNIWLDIQPSYQGSVDLSWLQFKNCSNIKILGGNTNFDSEQLQFIQATITGWNATAGTIDIIVMPGYDAAGFQAQQGNMSWTFSPQGVCKTRPSYSAFTSLDPNDLTKKRITVGTGYFTDGESTLLQAGDIFFTRHNSASWTAVISCDRSNTNFEIDGINSWYGPMWCQDCSKGTFTTKNCSNYRRPGTNRIGGSQEPPIYANMHTLIFDGCTAGGPGQDDGIDSLGFYSLVADVSGPQTITLFSNVPIGSTINLYDPYTFAPEGQAVVQTMTQLTDSTKAAALVTAVNQYQASLGARKTLAANQQFWVATLDRSVAAEQFAAYDCDELSPNITVTNSYFADMNAQALFVKGHNITVIGNRIDRSNATAIHAQISRYWWEGPVPQNVTIQNNIINNNPCAYGAPGGMWNWALSSIGVEVEGSLPGVAAIQNVNIANNTLTNSARIPILVKNAADVDITNNTIVAAMPTPITNASLTGYTYGIVPNAAIFIAASRGVTVTGNTLSSPTAYCPNLVQMGPYDGLGAVMGPGIFEAWTSAGINCRYAGSVASYSGAADVWTLNSNGWDLEGSSDQFLYVSGAAVGDHTVDVEVTGMANNTADWAKAGVMLRDSSAANSAMVNVATTPAHDVQFQWRTAAGAAAGNFTVAGVPMPAASNPVWLRLVKSAGSYSAFYSLNGATWTQVGATQAINFSNSQYLVGLSATSRTGGAALNTATFTGVHYSDGWNAETLLPNDVNNHGIAGSAVYNAGTGVWTASSGGWDISGAADQFTYVNESTSGNRTFVAKVTGMVNTNEWAKTGLMFRGSLDAGSAMVNVAMTPSHGVQFAWRTADGSTLSNIAVSGVAMPTVANPVWLKLSGSGSSYSAYYSLNGSTWIQVGSAQMVGFSGGGNYLAGFSVASHASAVNTSTFGGISFH